MVYVGEVGDRLRDNKKEGGGLEDPSSIHLSAMEAGSVGRRACLKAPKHASLSKDCFFVPITTETSGVISAEATLCLSKHG